MEAVLKSISGGLQKTPAGYAYDGLLVRQVVEDDLLAYMYLRLLNDGGLKKFYHESQPTVTEFIRQQSHARTLGCFEVKKGLPPVIVGLGFADPISIVRTKTGNLIKAETGMVFLRGAERTVDFGRMMLKWAFDELQLDVAYGTTPSLNRLALAYREKLGFKTVGELPLYTVYNGTPCSALISAVTRDEFNEFLLGQVEVSQ